LHGFSFGQHSSISRSIVGSKRELRLIENQVFVPTTRGFPEKSCILDFMRYVRLVVSQLRVDETFAPRMA
jgi:hypothetical protein